MLDIVEQKTSVTSQDLFERFKKIKSHELTVMTRQLATMVASGMSILRSFHVLEDQTENEKLKEILGQVRQDVEAGISLSDALEKYPDVFNQLYVAMVRTGETAGMLEESLMRVADQLEKADSLRRQVTRRDGLSDHDRRVRAGRDARAGRLPDPGLRERLQGLQRQAARDHAGQRRRVAPRDRAVVLLIAMTVGTIFGFKKWKKTAWGHRQWDTFKLKIPAKIGDVILKIALARWSRTFSGLVHSGVPILQAIDITGAPRATATSRRRWPT